jgi:hypothetical protein
VFKRISDYNEMAKELKAHAIGNGNWENLSTVLTAMGIVINEYASTGPTVEMRPARQACLDGIKSAYRTMRIL